MSLQLTIACGDYDRTHPLIDGSIKPEGIELNWLVLPHLEIWTRMLNYYDFDASEISLSSYITAQDDGETVDRNSGLSGAGFSPFLYFYQHQERHSRAEGSNGQARRPWANFSKPLRFGCAACCSTNTASISTKSNGISGRRTRAWRWSCRNATKSRGSQPDRKPDQMFFNGELDAMMVPSLFPSLFNPPPHIRRLFQDSPRSRSGVFQEDRHFPDYAFRRDAARRMGRAIHGSRAVCSRHFSAPRKTRTRRLNDISPYKISLAWFRGPVEEQQQILGDDPWPYGLEKNRHVVETLGDLSARAGIGGQKNATMEELFAPNTLDL